MKKSENINQLERYIFSCFLISEQLLGKKLFKWISPMKEIFLNHIEKKLTNTNSTLNEHVTELFNTTPENFQKNYFNKSRPVVFRGAAKNWGCCQKWNLDYFQFGHGDNDVLLVNASGLTSRENHSNFEFLTLKELIDNIKSGGKKYLRFSPLLENNPDLVKDLNMNWLQQMRGGKTFACTYYMFMGGAGQKTLLHTDQPCNLYIQVFGRKKWTLYSPHDSLFMYPEISNTAYIKSPVDVDLPDFEEFKLFKYATKYEVELNPGDILYVPPHIWHFVENCTDTISVGYRYSSFRAALSSSITFSLLRILSTNPPIWKTMKYGKIDTNLIWGYAGGKIKEIMKEREARSLRGKN